MWTNNIDEIRRCLGSLSVSDSNSNDINPDKAFEVLTNWTFRIKEQRNKLFLIGNGASASMASHVAADLAKNGHIHTEVFTDLSLITAIANDISFEDVFAEPLKRRLVQGDMLVAISSSGKSPNILNAVKTTKQLNAKVVTLSAMDEKNPLRNIGDLNFYVPAYTYGMAETCHAALLHYWIDMVVKMHEITAED